MQNNMKQRLTTAMVLTTLLVVPGFAGAQTIEEGRVDAPEVRRMRTGGTGYYVAGLMMPRVGDASDVLQANGLPGVNRAAFFQGGGGHGWIGDLMIGGFGGSFGGGGDQVAGLEASYSGGFGMFQVGYDVLGKMRNFNLFPYLGIGGGGLSIDIKANPSETFDEVLRSPRTTGRSSVGAGGWAALIGVGTEYYFGKSDPAHSNGMGGFMLGLQAGYLYSLPFGDTWDLTGPGTNRTPLSFNGPMVMVTLGGGGAEWVARNR